MTMWNVLLFAYCVVAALGFPVAVIFLCEAALELQRERQRADRYQRLYKDTADPADWWKAERAEE